MTKRRGTDKLQRGLRTLVSGLIAGCAGFVFLVLTSCGGGGGGGGVPPPLPSNQTGSINAANTTLANCFVSDLVTCSTSQTGANHISALATGTISSTGYLFWGDSAGDIDSALVPTSTSTYPSPVVCSTALGAKILSLADVPTTSGPLFYATSSGIFYLSLSAGSGQCSGASAAGTQISGISAGALAYNSSASTVIVVTSTGNYYSCTTGTTPTCASHGALLNLQDVSPQFTAIASDPSYAIVYILSIGNTQNRIYAYSISGSGSSATLTYLMNYTGTELAANPLGITTFVGSNPTQSFCTTGACTFLDVANKGNTTITQYVLTYSGSTVSSINQFNNAYFDCDLINPSTIAALPKPVTGTTLNTPNVFIGENGLLSASATSPCLGLTSSYGNNVTAYTVQGE